MHKEAFKPDLHMHSRASDGLLSPTRLVQEVQRNGVTLMALTDHDTMAGVQEAQAEATRVGIEMLYGIELSLGGRDEIHVLGYGLCVDDPSTRQFLSGLMAGRAIRDAAMRERLSSLGMPVPKAEDAFPGRMDLARAMVQAGYARNIHHAFHKWLSPGRPAYLPHERLSVSAGIAKLQALGAVPILAHPKRLTAGLGVLSDLLPEWIEAGLSGIEVYHPSADVVEREVLLNVARTNDLLVTGGSDFHCVPGESSKPGDQARLWQSAKEDVKRLKARLGITG